MRKLVLTNDDIMLRLGLINKFHSDPKKKAALISRLANELPRSKRPGLYLILSSKQMDLVIQKAIDDYEIEPILGDSNVRFESD